MRMLGNIKFYSIVFTHLQLRVGPVHTIVADVEVDGLRFFDVGNGKHLVVVGNIERSPANGGALRVEEEAIRHDARPSVRLQLT